MNRLFHSCHGCRHGLEGWDVITHIGLNPLTDIFDLYKALDKQINLEITYVRPGVRNPDNHPTHPRLPTQTKIILVPKHIKWSFV